MEKKDFNDLGILENAQADNKSFIHNFVEICWIDPFNNDYEASMDYIDNMNDEGVGK